MKKLTKVVLISLLVGLDSLAQAQNPAKAIHHKTAQMKTDGMAHDCVVMEGGKMKPGHKMDKAKS